MSLPKGGVIGLALSGAILVIITIYGIYKFRYHKNTTEAPKEEEAIPILGVAGRSWRGWMSRRGVGPGVNIGTQGNYQLRENAQPDDPDIEGAILLPDLDPCDKDRWRKTGKNVMVEPNDPERDDSWENMAPSLTFPFEILVAAVLERRDRANMYYGRN
ncbi:hypothetical protein F53441_1893 [Fusarium austroafricanum]|uniref:Uncharacterized protein n=1 Tax=Fusarium austroafricanum TaxID=2364996 RepID=A0A8H4KTI7_9HYPO|nr:hypothetical protein F53441_1893 [Fusarium austroafricanum]